MLLGAGCLLSLGGRHSLWRALPFAARAAALPLPLFHSLLHLLLLFPRLPLLSSQKALVTVPSVTLKRVHREADLHGYVLKLRTQTLGTRWRSNPRTSTVLSRKWGSAVPQLQCARDDAPDVCVRGKCVLKTPFRGVCRPRGLGQEGVALINFFAVTLRGGNWCV